MTRWILMTLLALFLLTPAAVPASDYWPSDATRTYVFGSSEDELRFVIEPVGVGLVSFRVVGQGCDLQWTGTLEASGRLQVPNANFSCPGVIDPELPLTFESGSVLFDPAWIGGNIQLVQATSGTAAYNLSVRIGAPRTITVAGTTYETVLFELGIEDPLLLAPFVQADLDPVAGPVRVNGLDRTAVIGGIVDAAERSWGGLKARFD